MNSYSPRKQPLTPARRSRSQDGVLRDLCAFQTLTQRAQSISGASVLSPCRSRRTRSQSVQEEQSSRAANKLSLGSAEAAENAETLSGLAIEITLGLTYSGGASDPSQA